MAKRNPLGSTAGAVVIDVLIGLFGLEPYRLIQPGTHRVRRAFADDAHLFGWPNLRKAGHQVGAAGEAAHDGRLCTKK
jgi:hypothetical protein